MDYQEFNWLVLNNSEGLKPFAINLTRDHEAARDLYQETMFKAFAYRNKYEPGTNIRAWLFTIMRNIFINDYRKQLRKKVVMEEKKYLTPVSVLSPDLTAIKEIYSLINDLPSIFRTACLLYLEGYQYQEIAGKLNEPLGTIKSRIHFAKKNLQKKIVR
jgi:RNA polymerase sigma factor (sigma-70 family)